MKVKIDTKALNDNWVEKGGGRTTLPFCKYFLKVNDTEVVLVEGLKWWAWFIGLLTLLLIFPFALLILIGKLGEWVVDFVFGQETLRKMMCGVWSGAVREDALHRDQFSSFCTDVKVDEKDVQRVLNRVKTSPINKE